MRVLTDDDQSHSQGSDIQKFREVGIPVRMDNSPAHMHNKFCIIDNAKIMNGSLNWTIGGLTQNNENVVITNDYHLVKEFQIQYDRLWAQFA